MVNIVEQAKELSPREQLWLVGCYGAWYNGPAAEYFWQSWPAHIFAAAEDEEVLVWLREHKLPYRRERRAIRTPEKTLRYLRTWATWTRHVPTARARYEDAWRSIDAVYGVGRYIKMKLLEALHRLGYVTAQPDMRAKDGWSPAEGLALMHAGWSLLRLLADLPAFEHLGAELAAETGHSMFAIQVWLCEYKQAWAGKQYPGRSLDSEIEYHSKVRAVDPAFESAMWEIRKHAHPTVALGELRGWSEPRGCGQALPRFGYVWTDLLFDHLATTDLANPVRWPAS
jgi:hypothetical protein